MYAPAGRPRLKIRITLSGTVACLHIAPTGVSGAGRGTPVLRLGVYAYPAYSILAHADSGYYDVHAAHGAEIGNFGPPLRPTKYARSRAAMYNELPVL